MVTEGSATYLSWSPATQALADYSLTLRVRDNGSPTGEVTLNIIVRVAKASLDRLPGDADGNGFVDERDTYEVWQNLIKPLSNRNMNDDLNGDGGVTLADLNLVRAHLGESLAQAPAPAALPTLGLTAEVIIPQVQKAIPPLENPVAISALIPAHFLMPLEVQSSSSVRVDELFFDASDRAKESLVLTSPVASPLEELTANPFVAP
jgi:hypothetical protein